MADDRGDDDIPPLRAQIQGKCTVIKQLIQTVSNTAPESVNFEMNSTQLNVQRLGILLNKSTGKTSISGKMKGTTSAKGTKKDSKTSGIGSFMKGLSSGKSTNKDIKKGGVSNLMKGFTSGASKKDDTKGNSASDKSELKDKMKGLFRKEIERHKKNLAAQLDNKVPGMSLKETLKKVATTHLPKLKQQLHDEIDNHIETYIKNSKTLDELIELKIKQIMEE